MTAIPAWFERKFDFAFPAGLLPNVLARLRGTPARLDEALRNRPQSVLTEKSGEKWSPQEHAGHLVDLEPLWLARINDFVAGAAELTVTDLQNQRTHDAHHNARPLEDILFSFRTHRVQLIRRIEQLQGSGGDAQAFTRTIPHPRMKTPMRLVDHLYFVAEHDDHHLAQIWQLVGNRPL